MEELSKSYRSHTCGELKATDKGKEVSLKGWVHKRRDLGNLTFIDLRDRYGITQIVFDPNINKELHENAKALRGEFVIGVVGEVNERPKEMQNSNMATGEIEVRAKSLEILNKSQVPPFPIEDEINANEATRLKYRYLDLRRPCIQKSMVARHRITSSIREYMNGEGFLDIETPFLTKSTPEGARDYVVPSRIEAGNFYALPQSPQLFKQILMISGFDKYYQVVRCFRDEDLRHDRQPEFTQLDAEMSFPSQELIFKLMEGLFKKVMFDLHKIEVKTPFRRFTYREAIAKYGSDKPDIRFELTIEDLTKIFEKSEFKIFQECIKQNGNIKGLNLKGGGALSRKNLSDYETFAKESGAKGLIWIKLDEKGETSSPIAKYLSANELTALKSLLHCENGDVIFIVSDFKDKTSKILGDLRLKLAKDHKLIKDGLFSFCWVTDFPLFEYSENEKRLVSMHHPFTSPNYDDLKLLENEPQNVRALAYDIVLNGYEMGGGSIRIHDSDLQRKIFNILNLKDEDAKIKFGFLLEALKYGAPPHGGIALGIDRICMVLSRAESLRDVIAFPKTQTAQCLMTNAPSSISEEQLNELSLTIKREKY